MWSPPDIALTHANPCGLIDHQPVGWIRLMQKVVECFALKLFQLGIVG